MHFNRIIPAIAAFALGIAPGQGAITVVNTNSSTNGFGQASPGTTTTLSFNAGATADMLVVAYSGEVGNANVPGPAVRITYDGNEMIRAVGGASPASSTWIWPQPPTVVVARIWLSISRITTRGTV